MFRGTKTIRLAPWILVLFLGACSPPGVDSPAREAPPAPVMPPSWNVTTDFEVPVVQVRAMSKELGVELGAVRNTIYDVNGKQVQINVIVTMDIGNAEKLMTKLKTIKIEETLLQKDLIVYEFVGQNDVLPVIAEGRKHIDSM